MPRDRQSLLSRRDWLRLGVLGGVGGVLWPGPIWAQDDKKKEAEGTESDQEGEKRPADVPAQAVCYRHSEHVRVYHWWSMLSKTVYRVYARPDITRWPEGNWGAKVGITPIPFCCGARKRSKVWRKSRPDEIMTLADLTTDKQYQVDFGYI